MMIEIKMGKNGLLCTPVEGTQPENPVLDQAIANLQEGAPDPARDQRRRDAFLEWAAANTRELDILLDDLRRYGALHEHEYFAEAAVELTASVTE